MDDQHEDDEQPVRAPKKKSSAGAGGSRPAAESGSGSNLPAIDASKALGVLKKIAFGAGSDSEPAVIPPGKTMFFELQFNFAAALCYFPMGLSILAPALWLYSEPRDNTYLRFHSIQALVLTGGMLIFWTITGTISAIFDMIPLFGIFSMLVSLLSLFISFGFVFISVKQMLAVYKGKRGRLPIVADFADRFV